jgi:hypothetical protein
MGKKAGGAIKLAKGGGLRTLMQLRAMQKTCQFLRLQQSMQSGQLKGKEYIGMPILQNKVAEAERMKMAQR